MTNPPRAKGTQGENQILDLLTQHGIQAHRTSASTASHDIRLTKAPHWVIEVKNRRRWAIADWVRKARRAATHPNATIQAPWVVFAIPGDMRTREGSETGVVAVLDADFAAELISHWLREN